MAKLEDSNNPNLTIERSAKFILFMQLESICQALRLAIQTNASTGNLTIKLMEKLRQDLITIVEGRAIKSLPELADPTTADLLAFAETARGTILAFLTSEEIEEQKQMGFPVPPLH